MYDMVSSFGFWMYSTVMCMACFIYVSVVMNALERPKQSIEHVGESKMR